MPGSQRTRGEAEYAPAGNRREELVGPTGTKPAQKAHSLISQVYDMRNLRRAWEKVKANKGSAGVDGMTIAKFGVNHEHYLEILHRRLKDGSYRPRPVKRVEIEKPGSKAKRPLGIPSVLDRVCQQAVVQVLEPIYEPTFSGVSFGFRPGRSAHQALRRVWGHLQQGEWVVDADIADFFGTLSHELLIDLSRNEWRTAGYCSCYGRC